jgi:hypothetical protein
VYLPKNLLTAELDVNIKYIPHDAKFHGTTGLCLCRECIPKNGEIKLKITINKGKIHRIKILDD